MDTKSCRLDENCSPVGSLMEIEMETTAMVSEDEGEVVPEMFEDQNQNRVKSQMQTEIDMEAIKLRVKGGEGEETEEETIYENSMHFFPSTPADLDVLKTIRKVNLKLSESGLPCSYKITDESHECVFESLQGETNGSLWSRYFRQQQKIILMQDKNQHAILKLEFGRSRTISCFQTLRFVAMTLHFKSKSEDPLCIVFKDRGCCIWSCCWSTVTYETVPQSDNVSSFTVSSKRQWRNKAEFMVKHSDGSILAFIDREKKSYTLTMGENLGPSMKVCLIGFVIAMDIMDREDTGKLSCRLRPSTYVTILFLLILFMMIGAFLLHFIMAMILTWPQQDKFGRGCSDSVHNENDLPTPINYTVNHNYEPTNVTFQDNLI